MDAAAILSISVAVTSLTQLVKLTGLPDRLGPLVVLFLGALGVYIYGWASPGGFTREQGFAYFSTWILVCTTAVGVYKLSRSVPPSVNPVDPSPIPGVSEAPAKVLES